MLHNENSHEKSHCKSHRKRTIAKIVRKWHNNEYIFEPLTLKKLYQSLYQKSSLTENDNNGKNLPNSKCDGYIHMTVEYAGSGKVLSYAFKVSKVEPLINLRRLLGELLPANPHYCTYMYRVFHGHNGKELRWPTSWSGKKIERTCGDVLSTGDTLVLLPGKLPETFDDMDLRDSLLRGIYAYGFDKPSEVQQRAILPMLQGHDIIVQAPFNAGKTVAYVISILQMLDLSLNNCQAVVLLPYRALTEAIHIIMKTCGDYMNFSSYACIGGGVAIPEHIRILKQGVQVVFGTPGLLFKLIYHHNALQVDHCKLLCLDDAYEIFDRGFKDEVCDIFKCLPESVQVTLFSRIITPDVLHFTRVIENPRRPVVRVAIASKEGHSIQENTYFS